MPDPAFGTYPKEAYPACLELTPELENRLEDGQTLSRLLANEPEACDPYPFLPDLAKIEEAKWRLLSFPPYLPKQPEKRQVNPALELIPVAWSGLPEFLSDRAHAPQPGSTYILVMIKPGRTRIQVREADARDLLALKIMAEDMGSRKAAAEGGVSVGAIDELLFFAEKRGLLLAPPSRIRRPPDFPKGRITDPEVFTSPTFTLQWHVTQACDLNCRHCYDRSDRSDMTLPQALAVLDDLYDFCKQHNVFGQVSFTGGNPLLYPHFDRLYTEAADRGFMTAVLGNPMPRARIESLINIQKLEFYQVSLEGTTAHNDYVRGDGHFDRTLKFLEELGELGVYRMVMLTLTRDNMGQVLELADHLKERTELFTFNRLAPVGQGAQLAAVAPADYPEFLQTYFSAAQSHPFMSLKDNLFNLLCWQQGMPTGGGCTGHGCGAAFNFVSLLPDGEVHACRKLPSLIGNIYEKPLNDIYHGDLARRYRAGSSACRDCEIRPVCGACLAVGHGFGNDIFNDPDPYCFRFKA